MEPLRDSDIIDKIMIGISFLGNSGAIFIAITVGLLLFRKSRGAGVLCATALALDVLLVNIIIKPLIARARPFDAGVLDIIIALPHDYSFPSGHTAVAFAFAAALIPFGKKIYLPALIFAVVMGFSRLYLGVHYPSDVLVGAAIGFACGRIACFIWRLCKNHDIINVWNKTTKTEK